MNQDKICLYIVLLYICVTFGKKYLNINGIHLSYTISTKDICHTEDDRFSVYLGLPFENCVKECGLRPHCRELNFDTGLHFCELFSTVGNGKKGRSDCLRVISSDIEIIKRPAVCEECAYGEACEIDHNGAGICMIKECVNLTILANGDIKGNMRKVGAKIRYTCNAGFKERNGVTTGVCLDTGQWNEIAVCVEESNIAKGKTANQSSSFNNDSLAQNAVDGTWSPISCSATAVNQTEGWWEVNLGKEYAVKRVVVQTRESKWGTKFRNITVTIGPIQNSDEYRLCSVHETEARNGSKVELECNQIIKGQYVRISKKYNGFNDILVICEVAVFLW